jgi:hypothetical protein
MVLFLILNSYKRQQLMLFDLVLRKDKKHEQDYGNFLLY